jgi:hypothetical protein
VENHFESRNTPLIATKIEIGLEKAKKAQRTCTMMIEKMPCDM